MVRTNAEIRKDLKRWVLMSFDEQNEFLLEAKDKYYNSLKDYERQIFKELLEEEWDKRHLANKKSDYKCFSEEQLENKTVRTFLRKIIIELLRGLEADSCQVWMAASDSDVIGMGSNCYTIKNPLTGNNPDIEISYDSVTHRPNSYSKTIKSYNNDSPI